MISFLVERLSATQAENKILKESLSKTNNELQSSRVMCTQTASKLSRLESQIGDSLKSQIGLELVKTTGPISSESTLVSISEDDEVSCAESWASALITELENFRHGKPKAQPPSKCIVVPDLSLMDDFVEMEKLAIISVEDPFGWSHSSDESNRSVLPLELCSKGHPLEATGKELVPIGGNFTSSKNFPSWLQDILRVISEQSFATQRSNDEVLQEVRVALANMKHTIPSEVTEARKNDLTCMSGCLTWRNADSSLTKDSFDAADSANMLLAEISSQTVTSDFSKSMSKIVELIERVDKQQLFSGNSGSSTDYMVRVFQWKGSELTGNLHNFIHICNELEMGTTDVEKFLRILAETLEWIMNHCFSLQDVSSMKDSIKKHLDLDESHSESEVEVEDCKDIWLLTEKRSEVKLKEDNKRLKDVLKSMEFEIKVLEERLQVNISKEESLITQLQESQQNVTNLNEELAVLKESQRLSEDQIENQKLLNADLDTQLTVAKVELNEARQKFSSLEAELEDKSNCCHELESTCLELQLQLESVANKDTSEYGVANKETSEYGMAKEAKQLRTDWEITAASEKLAECQETILNLGRQLKALASPQDVALFDKVITTTGTTRTNYRSSLLDQMIAEDDAKAEELLSPKTKEIICTSDSQGPQNPNAGLLYGKTLPVNQYTRNLEGLGRKAYNSNENKGKAEVGVGSLAIVPRKQKIGGGFLRKLLMRRKRGDTKKTVLAIAAH
ncbi:filament-like plant protein 7 [Aristolochia californica]|uniref:filament-like plant protein 7 n=1 Tax=Aristolochia californica TaxID=171875 RepID=UPI0035D7B37F